MRLTRRIERIEAAVPQHPRDPFGQRRPGRPVSEPEANATFLRVLGAIQADISAFLDGTKSSLDEAAFEHDVETLRHWSLQRALPHDAELSRARQQALAALSDDQLHSLVRLKRETEHGSAGIHA